MTLFVFKLQFRVLKAEKINCVLMKNVGRLIVLYLWIILQILLESLPVSSSGHVALMQKYVSSFGDLIAVQDQLWIVDFLLHGPMIIILLLFFFKTWWQIIFQTPFVMKNFKSNQIFQSFFWKKVIRIMTFGLIADGITICFWWLDILPQISLTVGFAMTATLLYATRFFNNDLRPFDMSFAYAFWLGIGQSLSFLPGVSRFATTYAVGHFCGYSGRTSFAISFLIQFPLLIAAFIKGTVAMHKNLEFMRNFFDFKVLFVILTASIVSYALLWCVDVIIKKNKLWQFSWYMLVPIVLTLFV